MIIKYFAKKKEINIFGDLQDSERTPWKKFISYYFKELLNAYSKQNSTDIWIIINFTK